MAHVGEFSGKELIGCSVEALLGFGALGEVYRAVHPALAQPIALKILTPEVSSRDQAGRQLRSEVGSVATLYHPAIIRVFGIDIHEDRLVISMPLAHESLASLLVRQRELPLDWCVRHMLRIAAGLQAAHDIGIVHGDLKPTNILLDTLLRAIITDFGQSHQVSNLAESVASYRAPELLAGQAPTPCSDVFALAVMLYQMVTGVMPPAIDLRNAANTRFVPPSKINNMVDEGIDYVIMHALAPNPADRYADVLSFSLDLRAAQSPGNPDLLATTVLRLSPRRSSVVLTMPILPERTDQAKRPPVLHDVTSTSLRSGTQVAGNVQKSAASVSAKAVYRDTATGDTRNTEVDSFPVSYPLPAIRLVPVSVPRRAARLWANRRSRVDRVILALFVLALMAVLVSTILLIVLRVLHSGGLSIAS